MLWELAAFVLAGAMAARVASGSLLWALLISGNILIAGLTAQVLSFAGANHPANYLAIASFFGVTSLWMRARWRRAVAGKEAGSGNADCSRTTVIAAAFGLVLAISIRPFEELDSLYNLHYVAGWLANRTTPYEFAFNYVPFWELTYVPALVLTHSDVMLWFNSLKPIAIIGLLLYSIGRELGLCRTEAVWLSVPLLLFQHLWVGPSGVATIKNDMVHAAGQAMVAAVAVRAALGHLGRADFAFACLAAVFVSTKFSGPFEIAGAAVAAAVLARSALFRYATKTGLAFLCGAGGVWFATAGHYYLRNFLAHGNPVFPFQLNVGFLHLPGSADLSNTSILYSLGDPRVWRALFLPEEVISHGGIFFPLVLAGIAVTSVISLARTVRERRVTEAAALGAFQAVAWAIYVTSVYSASARPGDLAFLLNDLNSLRYVEGAFLVGELWMVRRLWASRAPKIAICAALGVQAASRVWLILQRASYVPSATDLGIAVCSTAVMLLAARVRWRSAWVALAGAGFLWFGAATVERRRPQWLERFRPIYGPVYEAQGQRIYMVVEDKFTQEPCLHFPLLGRRLRNEVSFGPLRLLPSGESAPEYVAWAREAGNSLVPPAGYAVLVDNPAGSLYKRLD